MTKVLGDSNGSSQLKYMVRLGLRQFALPSGLVLWIRVQYGSGLELGVHMSRDNHSHRTAAP